MRKLVIAIVGVVAAVTLMPVAMLVSVDAPALAASPVACVITGTIQGLSADQSTVVEAIAGRAELVGYSSDAIETGIIASLALTKLTNVAPSSSGVGIFAFDANGNWGPADELTDASEDALLFYAVYDQQTGVALPPSATTGGTSGTTSTGGGTTSGSQYSPEATLALAIMNSDGSARPLVARAFQRVAARASIITGEVVQLATSEGACTGASDSTLSNVGTGALPANYQIPSTATPQESEAISAAIGEVGQPYVWGGASPATGFDCSGLMQWAWAQARPAVALVHYTVSQWQETQPLPSLDGASPGDLVLVPGSDGTLNPPNPQHVGMYIGNVHGVAWVVAAADQQLGVITQTYSSFIAGGLIAVGHINKGSGN